MKTKISKFWIFLIFGILVFSFALSGYIESKNYLHTYDYYSIIYDEEGDAIVAAKLIIQNTKNENLKEINLEIPGFISVYNLVQEVYESKRYPYYEYNYYYGSTFYPIKYEKEQTSSSTILKLKLPKIVGIQNQTSIILLYKIPKATKVDFLGNHEFDFETIIDKNAALIQNVRVAINVQEGLILKGGKANVEYKPDYFTTFETMKIPESGIQSGELSDFSSRITYAIGLVKNAHNLDPFESFHVRGKFSNAAWKLYFWEILLVFVVITLLLLSIKFFLWKKIKNAFAPKRVFTKGEEQAHDYGKIFIRATIFGFISAVLVSITFFALMFLSGWFFGLFYYSSYIMITPLFMLFGILIMTIVLFGPSIYVGAKYGVLEGLLTFIMSAVWLFIFLVAFLIFGFLFFQQPRYYASPIEKILTD
ncbi:MAG: hypothetical protein QXY62_02945 [Candidatus Altiarchaeota archaeon]